MENLPDPRFMARADRLARLLSDERGARILAEMQKLALVTARAHTAGAPTSVGTGSGSDFGAGTGPEDAAVGPWTVVDTAEGAALRRRELPADEARTWADVGDVPANGRSRRVVFLGESSARGFLLDPVFTPVSALKSRLETAAPDGFQCIDLAQTGATLQQLDALVVRLPRLRPDAVVLYAGNNWVLSDHTPAHLDLLAAALRDGGYPGMRDCLLERIVAPAARRLFRRLAGAAGTAGARVVVVIPQFNLSGWAPDPQLELPPLAPAPLARWRHLREEAEKARDSGDPHTVLRCAEEMTVLDRGTSHVPGHLSGAAAQVLGDAARARQGYEAARDAACGLLTTHTPRVTSALRRLMRECAAEHGFATVDLDTVLRRPPEPGTGRGHVRSAEEGGMALPDPGYFLDYCHLSDRGIELLAAAVADALLDLPAGSTSPGPGVSPHERSVAALLAAVHNSFYAQPRERVAELVHIAAEGAPGETAALHDVLGSNGPVWAHPAVEALTGLPHAGRYLAPMLTRQAQTLGMWSLREVLDKLYGSPAADDAEPADGRDLLAAAEQGLLDDSFRPPNHRPERSYLQCFAPATTLGFALARPTAGVLTLVHRTPGATGPAAGVTLNGRHLGTPPAQDGSWRCAQLEVPESATVPGVNRLVIHWPDGGGDWQRRESADAAALARNEFPAVLAVQGELFEVTFAPALDESHCDRDGMDDAEPR
ncbi:hypothetical protein HCC61_03260 [Streptomyces sp. HNM0575]|uniref:hypothetical protein n=1 Tax=Streptomyces sp. HNM0575 TaxID=2716338 RepID=UPI00145FAE97|nr:hypothetical protein [Streptomyces sp. HNM0575]NLU71714.1 hypothetical protein [Streptomyces sp. HNM0575]